jgi:hypothetical protein
MNRNTLYLVIGALAVATMVIGYQLYQGPPASRSMSATPAFPSRRSNFH